MGCIMLTIASPASQLSETAWAQTTGRQLSLVESAPPGRTCVPECLTVGARGWVGAGLCCGQSGTGWLVLLSARTCGSKGMLFRHCVFCPLLVPRRNIMTQTFFPIHATMPSRAHRRDTKRAHTVRAVTHALQATIIVACHGVVFWPSVDSYAREAQGS